MKSNQFSSEGPVKMDWIWAPRTFRRLRNSGANYIQIGSRQRKTSQIFWFQIPVFKGELHSLLSYLDLAMCRGKRKKNLPLSFSAGTKPPRNQSKYKCPAHIHLWYFWVLRAAGTMWGTFCGIATTVSLVHAQQVIVVWCPVGSKRCKKGYPDLDSRKRWAIQRQAIRNGDNIQAFWWALWA